MRGLLRGVVGVAVALAWAAVAAATARAAPYAVQNFTPVGANVAWVVSIGNQVHGPPQSVQLTEDGGAHWAAVTPPGLGRAGRSTAISSTDFAGRTRAWVIAGSPEGRGTLWRTVDAGRSWVRVGRTPVNCSLQFVDLGNGWCVQIGGAAGSEFVAIDRTTDGGRTWHEVSHNAVAPRRSSPDPIPFACDKSVTLAAPTLGFASSDCAGGGGFIEQSTDGGSRWHRRLVVPGAPGLSYGDVFTAVIAHRRWAAVGYTVLGHGATHPGVSVVYQSHDAGRRWEAVHPPGPARGDDVDIVTPEVWRLIAGRTVLATDNGGRTWTRLRADVSLGQTPDVDFTTPEVGWELSDLQSGSGDDVLRTIDDGRHWTRVHVPLLATPNQ